MSNQKWNERLAIALNNAKKKGKTIEKISYALGVKQGTVSNWKAGRREPSFNQMRELCEELGVSHAYILFGELDDEPIKDNPLLKSISRLTPDQQNMLSSLISNALSESEQDLLDKYGQLNTNNQAALLRLADNIIETQNPQKNHTILRC